MSCSCGGGTQFRKLFHAADAKWELGLVADVAQPSVQWFRYPKRLVWGLWNNSRKASQDCHVGI